MNDKGVHDVPRHGSPIRVHRASPGSHQDLSAMRSQRGKATESPTSSDDDLRATAPNRHDGAVPPRSAAASWQSIGVLTVTLLALGLGSQTSLLLTLVLLFATALLALIFPLERNAGSRVLSIAEPLWGRCPSLSEGASIWLSATPLPRGKSSPSRASRSRNPISANQSAANPVPSDVYTNHNDKKLNASLRHLIMTAIIIAVESPAG